MVSKNIDFEARLRKIVAGLTRAERRKGDEDVSLIVLDRFCEGWSQAKKQEAAFEIRTKARQIIRDQRKVAG